jgi:hypothetical protein
MNRVIAPFSIGSSGHRAIEFLNLEAGMVNKFDVVTGIMIQWLDDPMTRLVHSPDRFSLPKRGGFVLDNAA